MLVGPKSNPTDFEPSSDDIFVISNKIVTREMRTVDGPEAWICRSHLRHTHPLGPFLASILPAGLFFCLSYPWHSQRLSKLYSDCS
jgi:hypothetical protein